MLKYPAKNFGRVPMLGLWFKACWLMLTKPVVSMKPWHLLNGTVEAPQTPETFWSAVQKNKRLRYAKRHLSPFLVLNYGIQLPMKSADDLGKMMRSEAIVPLNSDKEYYLLGWDHIEQAAERLEPVTDLSGEVHLARVEDGIMTEAPRWDAVKDAEPATFSVKTDFPSVGKTEENIRSMIMDIAGSLPESRVSMEITAVGDELFAGVGASLDMEILDREQIIYSEDDLKILVNTAVFAGRMADACILIVSIELSSKTFIYGRLVDEMGYGSLDKKDLSNMISIEGADMDEIVFIDDLASLKALG